MKLHADIETFSECDLKVAGLYRYAEHPSTEVTVFCYAFDDGPVHVWIPMDVWDVPQSVIDGVKARPEFDKLAVLNVGTIVPDDLYAHLTEYSTPRRNFSAHNAQFERVVLNGVAGQKLNFPHIDIEQTVCTMAKCRAHGLPASLEDAAKALGTHKKMATGRNDMLAFSKPRKKEDEPRWTPANDPERFVRLVAYCIDDVKAERDIDKTVPDLTPAETQVYFMDQRMNDRGVAADLTSVGHVQVLIAEYKKQLEARCLEMTKLKPSQREKIADWIRANGYPRLTDMQADTVARLTRDDGVPQNCREVLQLYSTYGMKAVAKFDTIEEMVCADGRLRGMFQYHGAGTGRWSSTGVQLHNTMRPLIDDANDAIDLYPHRNLELIRQLYDIDPMKVFASSVRGVLVAGEGRELTALDYSGIEARIVAWVSGETWKLHAFNLQDKGEGPDNYRLAFARVFQIDPDRVSKKQRQIGKVLDLSMGFEGGIGALVKAFSQAGIDLNELTELAWGKLHPAAMESAQWMLDNGYLRGHGLPDRTLLVLDALKAAWRLAHPATANREAGCWRQLKDAAISAVKNPGSVFTIDSGLIHFKVIGDWLYLQLPSKRRIAYYKPNVREDERGDVLRYRGIDTEKRIWMETATYGGKLMQNVAEGVGRDLLVVGMQSLEKAGVPMIMCVHDEAVGESPIGTLTLDEAMKKFLVRPQWAEGLPLAAEGFVERRYRK